MNVEERTAQIAAHRACCGTEHDPQNGKLHGYCVVCGTPWPCAFAGMPPPSLVAKGGSDLRNMLRAMQNGEMTVSRGIELVDMWLAGNYSDDQLPPIRNELGEDEMPWDRIDALTAQRDELLKDAERLNFIESQGYPGMGWIARHSSIGRGYRLHQDPACKIETAREAIDAAKAKSKP